MADFSWSAAGGGDWNTAADWTQAAVPGAADTAVFDVGAANPYLVTGDAAIGAIAVVSDAVTFDGQLTVGTGGISGSQGAYVAIDGNAFVDDSGALAFAAGSTLEVDGLLVSDGGTLDTVLMTGINSSWSDAATVTLSQLYVYGGASFAGNLVLNDGGSLTVDTGSTFGGGTMSLAGSGTIYVPDASGGLGGVFGFSDAIVTGAAGTSLVLAGDPTAVLDVSGAISGGANVFVSGGTVNLAAGNSYGGVTVVDSATLNLTGVDAAGAGPVFLQDAALNIAADSTGSAGNLVVVGSGGADTVSASAGFNEVFAGSALSFNFQGGFGGSTVIGGSGVLTATAGAGGDVLFGGTSGLDLLTAGTGPTTLVGGAGGTLVAAGTGGDLLVAAGGNTTLNGGASTGGNLFFTQGSGATTIAAGAGQNVVVAGGANSVIDSASGTLDIFLTGGTSALAFTNGASGGLDVVTGFASGDRISLSGYGANEAQAVLASAVVIGSATFLTLTDNTQISLFGFTGLTAANFS